MAETFTAVILGVLQGVNFLLASESDPAIARTISSVIGQEGEQNGMYRMYIDQVPSESPFLTYVPAAFAWSTLKLFVVPGSCPFPLNNVDLPIFSALFVNGGPIAGIKAETQTLKFRPDLKGTKAAANKETKLFITYTSGQQLSISIKGGNVSGTAQLSS